MFISESFGKVIKIYNSFIFLILWIMWSKVCLAIYSAGNLSIFWWSVLTNLAGNTKNSARIVSKVACWNLGGRQSLLNQLTRL